MLLYKGNENFFPSPSESLLSLFMLHFRKFHVAYCEGKRCILVYAGVQTPCIPWLFGVGLSDLECLVWGVTVPVQWSLLSGSQCASPSFTWLKSLSEKQTGACHSCLKYPLACVASKMVSRIFYSNIRVQHISPVLFTSRLPCPLTLEFQPQQTYFCLFYKYALPFPYSLFRGGSSFSEVPFAIHSTIHPSTYGHVCWNWARCWV